MGCVYHSFQISKLVWSSVLITEDIRIKRKVMPGGMQNGGIIRCITVIFDPHSGQEPQRHEILQGVTSGQIYIAYTVLKDANRYMTQELRTVTKMTLVSLQSPAHTVCNLFRFILSRTAAKRRIWKK